jgi:hypothetical protein
MAIPAAASSSSCIPAGRIVFGDGHPAIDYLLLLAVADDLCGIVIIAIFYPDPSTCRVKVVYSARPRVQYLVDVHPLALISRPLNVFSVHASDMP